MPDPLILERHGYFPLFTLGYLILGEKRWCTVERPWLDNQPGTSCIPLGTYDLAPKIHHEGKLDALETVKLVGVPGRTNIEIHPANWAEELEGCIAPGTSWQVRSADNVIGVAGSRVAFNAWWAGLALTPATQIVVKNVDILGAL